MEQSLEPSDGTAINWPERPTCHDRDEFAQRFGPTAWRPAGVRLHPDNDHVPAFRTCSFCGSMHPEDLLVALRAGAKAGGSDWKYGWPHKFYVDGIPNSQAGNMVSRSSGSGPLPMSDDERARWERYASKPGARLEVTDDGKRWSAKVLESDGPTTHGKFYNTHLQDLTPSAFAELAPVLERHTGIRFEMKDGKLMYAAPRHGHQQ